MVTGECTEAGFVRRPCLGCKGAGCREGLGELALRM